MGANIQFWQVNHIDLYPVYYPDAQVTAPDFQTMMTSSQVVNYLDPRAKIPFDFIRNLN